MSRQRHELREYANQRLMDDLNEMMIRIKAHLLNLPVRKSKPTVEELDRLTSDLMNALKENSRPFIH